MASDLGCATVVDDMTNIRTASQGVTCGFKQIREDQVRRRNGYKLRPTTKSVCWHRENGTTLVKLDENKKRRLYVSCLNPN
jgi:hypothetical protein